jgi:hypothetical protein
VGKSRLLLGLVSFLLFDRLVDFELGGDRDWADGSLYIARIGEVGNVGSIGIIQVYDKIRRFERRGQGRGQGRGLGWNRRKMLSGCK